MKITYCMFISSLLNLALYTGVTEKFMRKAWVLESAKCMPILKEISYWNTASAWLGGSSYLPCAMTAINWRAQSYGVETISDIDAFACHDTTYPLSFKCCSTTQPYGRNASARLLYRKLILSPMLHPTYLAPRWDWGPFRTSSWKYAILYEVTVLFINHMPNFKKIRHTLFGLCQVHGDALWYTNFIQFQIWITNDDSTSGKVHTFSHQVTTQMFLLPFETSVNGLHR